MSNARLFCIGAVIGNMIIVLFRIIFGTPHGEPIAADAAYFSFIFLTGCFAVMLLGDRAK